MKKRGQPVVWGEGREDRTWNTGRGVPVPTPHSVRIALASQTDATEDEDRCCLEVWGALTDNDNDEYRFWFQDDPDYLAYKRLRGWTT